MKINCVFDASALLAVIRRERGSESAESLLSQAAVSAVNVSEVLARLIRQGATLAKARQAIEDLQLEILPFDLDDASAAASLVEATRTLSLGDRACLAAALRHGVPAVTANQNWRIPELKIDIRFIR